MKFVIYADPGHAWCKVPTKLLVKLGIAEQISTYSYLRGDYAYLEEDCDLTLLVSTLKNKGIPIQFDERHTNKSSKIRSYSQYRKEVIMSAKVINRVCLSVPGGWQSQDTVTGVTFGPVYNNIDDLWDWQKNNPVEDMKLVRNLMSGEYVLIDEDTPWCCNPASETYWSM